VRSLIIEFLGPREAVHAGGWFAVEHDVYRYDVR